jgi:hypothetical protein
MRFEVLVEDASGAIAVRTLLEKIIGPFGQDHTYRVHAYKGIGHIPKNLQAVADPQKRILLDRLPKILQGYGRSFRNDQAVVLVVVDLDDRDCIQFKKELLGVLAHCEPKPSALFRIAIEEVEAWYLGDHSALKKAYPRVREHILNGYAQDSICGTWEKLADAIYTGGSSKLRMLGYPAVGAIKCEWAEKISPHMGLTSNASKSFQVFRDGVRKVAGILA